jgi:hypothetical protein
MRSVLLRGDTFSAAEETAMIDQTAEPTAVAQPHRAAVRLARVAGAVFLPLVLGPFSRATR